MSAWNKIVAAIIDRYVVPQRGSVCLDEIVDINLFSYCRFFLFVHMHVCVVVVCILCMCVVCRYSSTYQGYNGAVIDRYVIPQRGTVCTSTGMK